MNSLVDSILNCKGYNHRTDILRTFKKAGKPVVIYGAGRQGINIAKKCIEFGINVYGFLEKEEYWYQDKIVVINDIAYNCINKSQLKNLTIDYNIIYSPMDITKLNDFKKEYPKCDLIEFLDASYIMDKSFIINNEDTLEELYSKLNDSESKDVLIEFLRTRYTGDVSKIKKYNHSKTNSYDWDLLKITPTDVLVDGGAYTGDTILNIERNLDFLPSHIFAFEPDTNNLLKLISNLTPYQSFHTHIIPCGLYSHDGELSFIKASNAGSRISTDGDTKIKIQALDNHKEYNNVSIIKLDIEGSELNALKGTQNIITANKPRLAICIYHKTEDITEIYNYLKKFEYSFYLRHHSDFGEETALYAI